MNKKVLVIGDLHFSFNPAISIIKEPSALNANSIAFFSAKIFSRINMTMRTMSVFLFRMPSFGDHIFNILSLGCYKKMMRIYARRVVALMTNFKRIINVFAMPQNKRKSMRRPKGASITVPHTYSPVAISFRSCPLPAIIRPSNIYFIPKSIHIERLYHGH